MRQCKICPETGYIITRMGKVISPQMRIGIPRERIKQYQNGAGKYNQIYAKQKMWSVSRLVLALYDNTKLPYKNDCEADHINNNIYNNKISNLRWLDQSLNKFKKTTNFTHELSVTEGGREQLKKRISVIQNDNSSLQILSMRQYSKFYKDLDNHEKQNLNKLVKKIETDEYEIAMFRLGLFYVLNQKNMEFS